MENRIALSEELTEVNNQLDDLLSKGSNDEKLVDRKRELEKQIKQSG